MRRKFCGERRRKSEEVFLVLCGGGYNKVQIFYPWLNSLCQQISKSVKCYEILCWMGRGVWWSPFIFSPHFSTPPPFEYLPFLVSTPPLWVSPSNCLLKRGFLHTYADDRMIDDIRAHSIFHAWLNPFFTGDSLGLINNVPKGIPGQSNSSDYSQQRTHCMQSSCCGHAIKSQPLGVERWFSPF